MRGADGKDRVLLDPNTWPTKDNPSLHGWHPSPDGTKLAYSLALHSADAATIHVLDVATAQEAARDAISEDSTGATWAADSKGFYYSFIPMDVPAAVRPGAQEIRFHRLGEDAAKDTLVRGKTGDPSLEMDFDASRDGHWLTVSVWSGEVSTAVYFRDLRARGAAATAWTTLCKYDHARISAFAYKDRFYLVTTDGAPNSRVMVVDPAHPEYEHWKEIVPERKDARLEDLSIVGGKLVLKYVKDAISRLEVHGLDGALVREIPLPDLGTASLPPFAPDDDEASFGGLLMGAALTQRPDLFRVVLCGAPLLDMIRFPLVGWGGGWTAEYGNPTKEDDFRPLLAYSPLHHVQSGVRYPSLLLMSPANDDRVDPMHARKFVAEVQAASTGGPALLRIERDSGHMGADSQKSEAGYYGDAYAFALAEIGAVGGSMNAK